MQINRIMPRCTRAAAEIVFVFSGFNEPTSFNLSPKIGTSSKNRVSSHRSFLRNGPVAVSAMAASSDPIATDLEKGKEHMQIYWLDQHPHTGQFRRK